MAGRNQRPTERFWRRSMNANESNSENDDGAVVITVESIMNTPDGKDEFGATFGYCEECKRKIVVEDGCPDCDEPENPATSLINICIESGPCPEGDDDCLRGAQEPEEWVDLVHCCDACEEAFDELAPSLEVSR